MKQGNVILPQQFCLYVPFFLNKRFEPILSIAQISNMAVPTCSANMIPQKWGTDDVDLDYLFYCLRPSFNHKRHTLEVLVIEKKMKNWRVQKII